jgi:hypothetical protein
MQTPLYSNKLADEMRLSALYLLTQNCSRVKHPSASKTAVKLHPSWQKPAADIWICCSLCCVADTIAADVMNDLGEHAHAAHDSAFGPSTSSSIRLPPQTQPHTAPGS